jgi:hypothetical protein
MMTKENTKAKRNIRWVFGICHFLGFFELAISRNCINRIGKQM